MQEIDIMNATDAVDVFTNLEFDMAAAALARNAPQEYEFAVSRDGDSLLIVTIRSSGNGTITFMKRDDAVPMTQPEVFDAFMTLNARRPGTIRLDFNRTLDNTKYAGRLASPTGKYAEENIASFAAAKGNYY
jgi:hypothetical protein